MNDLIDLSKYLLIPEEELIAILKKELESLRYKLNSAEIRAQKIAKYLRAEDKPNLVQKMLTEYGLSSNEGVSLLRIAESLLRIPDDKTADEFIEDVLKGNFKLIPQDAGIAGIGLKMAGMMAGSKMTSGLMRPIIKKAIEMMGNDFILAEGIEEAILNTKKYRKDNNNFSFDILGEGARTKPQADDYCHAYLGAASIIGKSGGRDSLSIKLSALCPQYHLNKYDDIKDELLERIENFAAEAAKYGKEITIDAEEASRLDLSIMLFEKIQAKNVGLAVQAYGKRSFFLLDIIANLARKKGYKIPVRLVKGAYWDAEIKHAQIFGLPYYPVFTTKYNTDISYLACAKKMLLMKDEIYPQFATHNAYTIAAILEMGGDMEFQRLYGMGERLFTQIPAEISKRIYAPIGRYHDLLPYLIRRILENGANNSFMHQIYDKKIPAEQLVKNPTANESVYNIPLPAQIFSDRPNSKGFEIGTFAAIHKLTFKQHSWKATSIIDGVEIQDSCSKIFSPADLGDNIGEIAANISIDKIEEAINIANIGFEKWSKTDVAIRVNIARKIAGLFQENHLELYSLLIREAGKTLPDAIAEVREAIDFCYYYANNAEGLMQSPIVLNSYTGERNELSYHAKGVFLCISPWNFPMAIFCGQIIAALVTGNSVVAKAAAQTNLIAHYCVKLMYEAGIPKSALNFIIASGADLSHVISSNHQIRGIVFTGSNKTAAKINLALAKRGGEIISFIAETGGINAMIIDSTTLLETALDDVIISAFGSAGQRCSALRVLYVQEEIADQMILLIKGAMENLKLGSGIDISNDISAIIDQISHDKFEEYVKLRKVLYKSPSAKYINGYFFPPHIVEISSISQLDEEMFGPILHIIRYKDLNLVTDEINNSGYGLTFGIATRIESRAQYLANKVRAGNIYINRSMIGAVVGIHPFGGERLSGTGFKAGGPNYLLKFVNERLVSNNIVAIGGNLELLAK